MNCKNPSSRLLRWRLRVEEYDYEIQYQPGSQNSNADFFSRNALEENKDEQCLALTTNKELTLIIKFY